MSDVADPVRPSDPRERLRHGFVTQARREIDELAALLKEGGADERDHARHALQRMADRASSLGLGGIEGVVRLVAAQVETGSPPSALGAVTVALGRQEHARLLAPIALVTGGRDDLLGPIVFHVAETLRIVRSVEDLLGEVWFQDAHAVIAPVKPRRELARLAAAAPGRSYAWGPAHDVPKRLTALADGAVGYFALPLAVPAVVERIRYDAWRRLTPISRVHLAAGTDLLGDAIEAAFTSLGISVVRSSTTADALNSAVASHPELIVTTGNLDEGDLKGLVGTLRADEDVGTIAVVLIGDEREHGLPPGAVDATVPADLPPLEIAHAIRRRLDRPGIVPHRDPLTGLPIRPALLARLDEEFARMRRTRAPLSVALIDLDGDPAGFDADAALRRLALVLRSGVRAYDLVGRLGGGAFLVAMPGCGAKIAGRRIADLRDAVAARARAEAAPERTFTAGVADSVRGLDSLLARADAALAVARIRGAGAVERDD